MNKIMTSVLLLVLFVVHLTAQSLAVNPTLRTVTATVGAVTISVEVASTPQELAQGLMFRERLSDNSGMIFCLPQEEKASFWMKNVTIPLSVAYLDRNGVILELWDMQPHNETPVWSRSEKIYYALEMNQGWFKLNQVKEGQRVTVDGKGIESLRGLKVKK